MLCGARREQRTERRPVRRDDRSPAEHRRVAAENAARERLRVRSAGGRRVKVDDRLEVAHVHGRSAVGDGNSAGPQGVGEDLGADQAHLFGVHDGHDDTRLRLAGPEDLGRP